MCVICFWKYISNRVSVKSLGSVWQWRVRRPASRTRPFAKHRELHLLRGLEARHAAGGGQQGTGVSAAGSPWRPGVSLLLFCSFPADLSWLYVVDAFSGFSSEMSVCEWALVTLIGKNKQKTLAVSLLFSGSHFKKYPFPPPPPKSVWGEQHHSVPVLILLRMVVSLCIISLFRPLIIFYAFWRFRTQGWIFSYYRICGRLHWN